MSAYLTTSSVEGRNELCVSMAATTLKMEDVEKFNLFLN